MRFRVPDSRKLSGTPPEFIARPPSDRKAALIRECKYRQALARYAVGKPHERSRDRQWSICPQKKGNYEGCRESCEYETDGDGVSHGTSNEVIRQVWITSHFGVLSKRPAPRMRGFSSSRPVLLLPGWAVKPDFQSFSSPPSRRPLYPRQAPSKGGRYQPNMLRCSRLL